MKEDVGEGWTPEELERGYWWCVWIWLKYIGFVYETAEEKKKQQKKYKKIQMFFKQTITDSISLLFFRLGSITYKHTT